MNLDWIVVDKNREAGDLEEEVKGQMDEEEKDFMAA